MTTGRRRASGEKVPDRSQSFGEEALGTLLDRAHVLPPHRIGPIIADAVGKLGGRDISVLLQDYGQWLLVPLRSDGLVAEDPQSIDGSHAGQAFLDTHPVEVSLADGVRVHIPLLDGGDQVGVMSVTLESVDDDARRLLRRIACVVADLLVTKHSYTDLFFLSRRREPMSLAAEIQWSLLPPLAMIMPRVAVAGMLEPAYDVAGDSFDYALNDDMLHVAMIDAMGHGLSAAVMATVAIGAYRHARRSSISLSEIYFFMDRAVADQFGPDHFVTAQMMRLDTATGRLQWVNAGHPAPLLLRGDRVVSRLDSLTTLPVGFGGEEPVISERTLEPGDRIVCFTDGLIEQHEPGEQPFGEHLLIDCVNRVAGVRMNPRAMSRSLSHALKDARGGRTTDDATILLIEWLGPSEAEPIAP
ncbi:PP2C family protein-serine/threonine phosphatase [Streptomyces sp. NPDC001046]|uniref:PP2C family protein-serine/threonine phosphatase n=1 Tax=Streptomyces sp. NPDC001046 TaxID=3364543 RepID=UPI00367DFCAA